MNLEKNIPFKEYFEHIRESKRQANAVMDIVNPGHHEAETTLALAWEALFDNFCKGTSLDLAALNTISAIIHKLTASYNQIKTLELKSSELIEDQKKGIIKEDALRKTLRNAQNATEGLTKETLQQVEQQLSLL